MTLEQLAEFLRESYHGAEDGERVTAIHLFGIRYVAELRRHTIAQVVQAAGLRPSYVTEVGKGMRLARHVELR